MSRWIVVARPYPQGVAARNTTATIRRIRRGLHPRHVIAVTAFVEIGLRTTRLAMLVRYLAIRLGLDGHSTPEAHQPDPVVLS